MVHVFIISILGGFLLASGQAAGGVQLNEIHANPSGPESSQEFVELMHFGVDSLWLEGYQLSDGTGTDQLVFRGQPRHLQPGGIALILDPGYEGEMDALIPADALLLQVSDASLGSAGLSNSTSEPITLLSPEADTLDLVWTRPELAEGHSLERRDAGATCAACWVAGRTAGGSPGSINGMARKVHDLEATLGSQGQLVVHASGLQGFTGTCTLLLGLSSCRDQHEWNLAGLAPGDTASMALPGSDMSLLVPLEVWIEDAHAPARSILDTLLLLDSSPCDLYIEAFGLADPQWIQLASGSPCPLLLDGMVLESRSRRTSLSGQLDTQARLLVGREDIQPACEPGVFLDHAPGLGLHDGLDLLAPDGEVLDQARWPDETRRDWQRIHPGLDGSRESSWKPWQGGAPGCPLPRAEGAPAGDGWQLGTASIVPGGVICLTAPASVSGAWQLEIWSLGGMRLWNDTASGLQCWQGHDQEDNALEPGLYLLRAEASGASTFLKPVTVLP